MIPGGPQATISNWMKFLTVCSLFGGIGVDARGQSETSAQPPAQLGPLTIEESAQEFVLHPDLKLELVAGEPQVADPVAIAFDASGRMWVAEMADYPNGPKEGEPPQSRIRVLEDRDGDGYFENARVFADQLLFANGVHPWRDGVIATIAGEVVFLRDTNGDGTADFQETWYSGFQQENPQLRANHPTFALDNQIYVANGRRGGDVIAVKSDWKTNSAPISISGMDFRFDPIKGGYTAVTGNGQFGLTFDDYGNRFVCSNRNPCTHVVLEDRYLQRNPLLAVRSAVADVSAVGADSRVYAISRTWTTSNLHAGQFTAACGVTMYRGNALPKEFYGNSFTCEPTGNLVHRDVHKANGATFRSQPGRSGIEFLASRDEWFRPVNMANGPDGALYLVDMYRAVIEHPQFMPIELKNRPDLELGRDRGRIYRIVSKKPATRSQTRPAQNLNESTTERLVELLEHSNGWHRETAARLIYERQENAAIEPLKDLFQNTKSPKAKIHALWALAGLNALTRTEVSDGLASTDPRVVEQAIRLAEPSLENDASILNAVLQHCTHQDGRVRFQVALSLGEATRERELASQMGQLAIQSASDPWTRIALATAFPTKPGLLLQETLRQVSTARPQAIQRMIPFVTEMAELVGASLDADQIRVVALSISEMPSKAAVSAGDGNLHNLQFAITKGLGRGLQRRGKSLASFINGSGHEELFRDVFRRASQIAESRGASNEERLYALSVIEFADVSHVRSTLLVLADEQETPAIRIAGIRALSKDRDPQTADLLLSGFRQQTPSVRRAIIDVMLSNTSRLRSLLSEIENENVSRSEIPIGRIGRLTEHRDPEIRNRARTIFADATPADRLEVLKDYRRCLTLDSDPVRGKAVFAKHCAACHRIAGVGVDVAPDIADSRTRTPDALLTNILDPNRAIDNNYFSYTVVTSAGLVLTGIISGETASSVTLKQQEGKTVTILRQDIEEMRSNGVSLMPVGLEKNISIDEMGDLISFIKNWRYLNGQVPIDIGNE